MTESNNNAGTAIAVDMAETTASCLRATAELQSRLAAGWLEVVSLGAMQRGAAGATPSVTTWSLEAMRLTAETMLRNIERYQECARRAAGGKP